VSAAIADRASAIPILTDRRVIARWGVLNRNQAAILLERVQDVTLERPFLLSLFREYGVLQIETAGEHSSERVSGGHHRLPTEHASDTTAPSPRP
jgi:uncharacterized membrane protein YdbT with pleckstrin-like domain